MDKTGVLISNLGSPDAPTTACVRKYLREFLSDPYVVDKPRWLWLPILYGIILNIRPARSAKKYQQIWQPSGSPLLIYSKKLCAKLSNALPSYLVSLGMRYGKPSLTDALNKLKKAEVNKIILLPLYPQYSFSTNKSTINQVKKLLHHSGISLEVIHDYHAHPLYIEAIADSIQAFWREHGRAEKLVFSFHGLPQAMIDKGDPYYDQCVQTLKLISEKLNLAPEDYLLTFQSRIGVEKWLQPYTMDTLQSLPSQGISNIQMICPGFACDCLETLEEIDIMYRKIFLKAGGQQYQYIPCLNDQETQVNLLAALIHKN